MKSVHVRVGNTLNAYTYSDQAEHSDHLPHIVKVPLVQPKQP